MFKDHTGVNIYKVVIVENWKLPKKLACATTDNDSFIVAFYDQGVLQLSCFGHSLDLATYIAVGD